jgi:hypothetical protein
MKKTALAMQKLFRFFAIPEIRRIIEISTEKMIKMTNSINRPVANHSIK